MLSLYQVVSDGLHWSELVKPLEGVCSPWLALLFALYMSFALFALLNVVTGVFVESALRIAEEDKKEALMTQMSRFFRDADEDGSGTINYDEFQAHLQRPEMDIFLKAVDLNREEARDLFHLLDSEETGEIDAEDIVAGCIRLHGFAKAIELAAFMHEYRRSMKRFNAHADLVERSLAWLCDATRLIIPTETVQPRSPSHNEDVQSYCRSESECDR